MDKFCLKWNEFDTNIREYFKKLRKEHSLFDVTLATDDGRKLQAHKVILSSGSDFFNEIFTTNIHTNIVIYLKGISSVDLCHFADFMYNGEASELTSFLETGKEFKVKGLLAEVRPCLQNHVNNIHTELISCDLCGKSGMNRKSYYMHKQRNH